MTRTAPKLTHAELEAAVAACPVRPGMTVRHHSGDPYRIIGITVDCKTNELRLSYSKIGTPKYGLVVFSRPADDFVEPRFVVEG